MSGIAGEGSVHAKDLSVAVGDVRLVESCAANAWPASMTDHNDGWLVRYSPGVSNRRANSVLPLFDHSSEPLSDRIDAIERFYGERNLPSRFMISPAVQPQELDEELALRDYVIDAPTFVQWGRIADVKGPGGGKGPEGHRVNLQDTATPDWMSVYMEGVEDAQEIRLKQDLIERIGSHHVLASISGACGTVAVGLCVIEKGWAGIFCMHTLHSHRRQGLAHAILGGLRDWAAATGAEQMYLQVEQDNPSARQFYLKSGFRTQYGYHYRTKEIRRGIQ